MKKRFATLVLCLILACAQTVAMVSCNGKAATSDKQSTSAQTEKVENQTPAKPVTSNDPADYEKPTNLNADLSIVCVSYKTLDKTHFIDAFKSDDGNYYMVLPSAVDLSNVALYFFTKIQSSPQS